MALSEDEKERRRLLLKESLIPAKYNNLPLKKRGEPGERLLKYITDEYQKDGLERIGAIVVSDTPGLAASFARDIVIAGASAQFYYLQTFTTRWGNLENIPQAFVIEWFEQRGADMPFSSSERYRIETNIAGLIEDGVILYIFTQVPINASRWWSEAFTSLLAENSRILEVRGNGTERGGKRTPVIDPKEPRQKSPQGNSRVRVR